MTRFSHLIAFDDAPFDRNHRGDVPIVGVAFAGLRLEGVFAGRVRRDGQNATRELARLAATSRYFRHTQALLLEGIALAGFNVVDLPALAQAVARPVLVVVRRRPDLERVRRALLGRTPGGARKWRLIGRAGPIEPLAGLFVQRAGLSAAEAESLITATAVNGRLPEPLRVAHLIAAAIADVRRA